MKSLPLKIAFLVILIGAFENINAQHQGEDNAVDSLRFRLKESPSDSIKAEIYIQLADAYSKADRNKALETYLEALGLVKSDKRRASLLSSIAQTYWGLGKFHDALNFYKKALTLSQALNDSTQIGKFYNSIAATNWSLGNWNDALQIYQQSLAIRKAINDHKGVSTTLNNIGLIYQDFGVYDQALSYHNEALEIAVEIDNIGAKTYSYSNIGNCYKKKGDYQSSLTHHKLAFSIYRNSNTGSSDNSYFLANIGMVFQELGQIDSALYYFQNSLIEAEKINNQHRISIAENSLGESYLLKGEIKSAANYLNRSYLSSLSNGYTELLCANQFALADIEERNGNTALALTLYKEATALKDSLFNKKEISRFTELIIDRIQEKDEIEKSLLKENIEIQNAVIKEERNVIGLLLVGGTLLLVGLVHIARSRESIKKLNKKLRASEQSLQRSNADKDKFFSIISHDLKSPFNAIVGFSNLIADYVEQKDFESVKKFSGIISSSALKAMDLLSNLMNWAMSQTGKMRFSPERIDINDLIKENVNFYSDIASQKAISMTNMTEGSIFVQADKHMINTILRNLIANAIKYTSNGGIQLSSEIKSDEVEIAIRDTGIGISEVGLKDLFRTDAQLSTDGTADEKGTGLGLGLCKEFVDQHQGQLWATSEMDKGSVFYFTVPLSTD
ncbi:MAG: tetratricopeptide repeat-containing sensor histidine kinase [Cyclobacteriaceae bacterium]